ncbi:hypothetical protein ACFL6C_08505 [Myxococcota bacterium]
MLWLVGPRAALTILLTYLWMPELGTQHELVHATAAPESNWSVSDARLVTDQFVRVCVESQGWAETFSASHGRPPSLFIWEIANQTGEAIDTTLFAEAIENTLLRSGKVEVKNDPLQVDRMLEGRLLVVVERTEAGAVQKTYVGDFAILDRTQGQPVCSARGELRRLVEEMPLPEVDAVPTS